MASSIDCNLGLVRAGTPCAHIHSRCPDNEKFRNPGGLEDGHEYLSNQSNEAMAQGDDSSGGAWMPCAIPVGHDHECGRIAPEYRI